METGLRWVPHGVNPPTPGILLAPGIPWHCSPGAAAPGASTRRGRPGRSGQCGCGGGRAGTGSRVPGACCSSAVARPRGPGSSGRSQHRGRASARQRDRLQVARGMAPAPGPWQSRCWSGCHGQSRPPAPQVTEQGDRGTRTVQCRGARSGALTMALLLRAVEGALDADAAGRGGLCHHPPTSGWHPPGDLPAPRSTHQLWQRCWRRVPGGCSCSCCARDRLWAPGRVGGTRQRHSVGGTQTPSCSTWGHPEVIGAQIPCSPGTEQGVPGVVGGSEVPRVVVVSPGRRRVLGVVGGTGVPGVAMGSLGW